MTQIQGGNVTLMVKNMETAIRFYTETLDMKLKNRYGDHWAEIDCPGISIALHPTGKEVKMGNNMQIGLMVNNLDQAITNLETKGIKINIQDDDQIRLASLTDPDGNILYLVDTKG